MITIWGCVAVAFILCAGFVRVLTSLRSTESKVVFASEYLEKYRQIAEPYLNNSEYEVNIYSWLTYNLDKMQRQLGIIGIVSYKPPYANYIINNYHLLANTLPQFRTNMAHESDIFSIDDMIVRYLGVNGEISKQLRSELFNPVVWLREGIRYVLLLPFLIISWLGLITSASVNNVNNSRLFKMTANIAAIISFISSVIGIILGWEPIVQMIRGFFHI